VVEIAADVLGNKALIDSQKQRWYPLKKKLVKILFYFYVFA